jgi:hypothetical protein
MKCIKALKETKKYKVNDIARVSDVEADEKVTTGFFTYVSKSEWKSTQSKKEEVKVETGKVFADKADKVITIKNLKNK